MQFFGHTLRLHPDTPAQKALQETLKPALRPSGRPALTWIKLVLEDLTPTLQHHNIKATWTAETFERLTDIASCRPTWRKEVWRSMGRKL